MVSNLLHEVDHYGIELWTEDDKLKYRAGQEGFPEHLKEVLKQHKTEIIQRLKQNESAKTSGWCVIHYGDSYQRRLSYSSEIYIFREEDESCTVWRGYWRQGEPKASSEKTIIKDISFREALQRANNYIQWLSDRKGNKAG
jgi:hypothetical protein